MIVDHNMTIHTSHETISAAAKSAKDSPKAEEENADERINKKADKEDKVKEMEEINKGKKKVEQDSQQEEESMRAEMDGRGNGSDTLTHVRPFNLLLQPFIPPQQDDDDERQ
jgi:hypothetical protein